MRYPQWATPVRRAHLVRLFQESGGFCVFGHRFCRIRAHDYETFIEGLIREWVAADMAERAAQWKEEQRRMHQVPDRRGWKRRFDPVARERFLQARPEFYLEGVGVDALTLTRRAKVRVPSTNIRLLVDVTAVRIPSKSARRKARRYRIARQEAIGTLCSMAVRDWWK